MSVVILISVRSQNRIAWCHTESGEMGWLTESPLFGNRHNRLATRINGAYGLYWDAEDERLLIADKIGNQVLRMPIKIKSGTPILEENAGNKTGFSIRVAGPTGISKDEISGEYVVGAAHAGAIYRYSRDFSTKTLLAGTADGSTQRVSDYKDLIPTDQMCSQSLNHPTKALSIGNGTVLFIERGYQCLRRISQEQGVSSVFSSPSREHRSVLWQPPERITTSDYHPAYPTDLGSDVHGTVYLSDALHHCVWALPLGSVTMNRIYYHPTNEDIGPGALCVEGNTLWIFDYNGPVIVGLDISQPIIREVQRIPLAASFMPLGCRRTEGTGMTAISFQAGA